MLEALKKFDLGKSFKSAIKYFVVAILGVLVAALVLTYGYKPEGNLEAVIWQWVVYPGIVAFVGFLNNIRKHLDK